MRDLAFTGTRHGMTACQRRVFEWLFIEQQPSRFHHGDCIGADVEAHDVAMMYNVAVILHPPQDESKRAYCLNALEDREPLPYLDRNHQIVDESELLIATPQTFNEVLRSGTWSTIRYAEKTSTPFIIIYPNGIMSRTRS